MMDEKRQLKFRTWSIEKQRFECFGIRDIPDWVHEAEMDQFTGCIDAYENDIYSGAILKKGDSIGVVVESADGWMINWVKNSENWNAELFIQADESVIIGSIYENPKLLEVQS
jgi:hypothetical protein